MAQDPKIMAAALRNFRALIIDAAAAQVALDESGNGAVLHKSGQYFGFHAQRGGDGKHVALGARCLHKESVAHMNGLAHGRGDTHAHARGRDQLIHFHGKTSRHSFRPYYTTR